MYKLISELTYLHSQFIKQGPKFLDTFNYNTLIEESLKMLQDDLVKQYINEEVNNNISDNWDMIPLYMEPNDKYAVALFSLAKGASMPLHDHPNMFVFTHVLKGIGEREAWDIEEQDKLLQFRKNRVPEIVIGKEYEKQILKQGDNCFTTPNKQNLHKFSNKSDKEIFLFLDVILPHYSKEREITYFEKIGYNKLKMIEEPQF